VNERQNTLAIDDQGVSLLAKFRPGFRARGMAMRQLIRKIPFEIG
jgi:hypothetical protein